MTPKTKRSLGQVLAAIEKSGGIKTVIAQKLGVSRQTLDSYLARWATARAAYEDECEGVLDMAESIVLRNLQMLQKAQKEKEEIVCTADAKWYLTMKGVKRGYAPKSQVGVEGTGEHGEVVIRFEGTGIDPAKLFDEEEAA